MSDNAKHVLLAKTSFKAPLPGASDYFLLFVEFENKTVVGWRPITITHMKTEIVGRMDGLSIQRS